MTESDSAGLVAVTPEDVHGYLAERLEPTLREALRMAGPGQRLRVTTLPEPVMEQLCGALQAEEGAVVRVLGTVPTGPPWRATPTKLIELRNAIEGPLLVFVPQGLRTAAEDSLDISTFTELSLSTSTAELVKRLLLDIADPLRSVVAEQLEYLRQQGATRHPDEELEYLLTVNKNGNSPWAAGGALFVLGLIPDFGVFQRGNPGFWLSKNRGACEILAEVGQPLQTRLTRLPVRHGTIQPALFQFLRERRSDDIRSWGREIACDSRWRGLAFDRWKLEDAPDHEELRLMLLPLGLGLQDEDSVADTVRLPVFDLAGRDPLKIGFRSMPAPAQYPSWKTFRVQVLSIGEGAPVVAWESNSFPKPAGRNAVIRRSIRVTDLQGLEEGVHFIRVEAFDGDGALLTASPRRVDPDAQHSRAENESERFFVQRDGGTTIPDARSVVVSSLLEAWLRVASRNLGAKQQEPVPSRAAMRGEWDEPIGAAPRGDVHFSLEGAEFSGFAVTLPGLLRKVEVEILQHPDQLGALKLSFLNARSLADVQVERRHAPNLGEGAAARGFFEARGELFERILSHHGTPVDGQHRRAGCVATVDVASHGELIGTYAAAFVRLAAEALDGGSSWDAVMAERAAALAQLDLVELRWPRSTGDPGRALSLAPTHPLRLLWYLRQTLLCQDIVTSWEDGSRTARWPALMKQLQSGLLPLNLPPALFDRRGWGYQEQPPLARHWPLYLPDRATADVPIDAAAARDRVRRALGARDRVTGIATVDCEDIADRLFEYVQQHPYADQLRLNVFNPGDGRLLADVLRALEKRRLGIGGRSAPSLRYAIHLFASPAHLDLTGEGLEELLDPERQVGEDDEFTLASSNHLLPKLVFSRNTTAEFLQRSEAYTAHVSILLEQFPVQVRVGRVDGLRRGSYVGGLVQEPETQVEGPGYGWVKGLKPGSSPGAPPGERLLQAALEYTQRIHAACAVGRPVGDGQAPVVALQLDGEAQALLREVHQVSDWVLTVDRNLGLDYFDSPTSNREVGYLLDYAPEYLHEDRQRLLLTTRSSLELESIVRPALQPYGLFLESGDEVVVLEALRSLSGRLALRLQAQHTHTAEVVGLLLARWLLESSGLLRERIVIPLDAHRSWFDEDARAQAPGKRADLLLVTLQPGSPTRVRVDVLEVKLREELPGAARSQLYTQMREQTASTVRRLRDLFDPDLYPRPRADALLRAKELSSVLAFYARRARRYGFFSDEQAGEALALAEGLDAGYKLELQMLGLVFVHKSSGAHLDEEEPGFPVHRFGGDKAQELLKRAVGRFEEVERERSQRSGDSSTPEREFLSARGPAGSEDPAYDSLRETLSVASQPSRPVAPSPARAPLPSQTPAPTAPPASGFVTTPHGTALAAQPGPLPIPPGPATYAKGVDPPVASTEPETSWSGSITTGDVVPGVVVGASEVSPQYGFLGTAGDSRVALDLNGCNTISLFGVQGFGKSYTLGVIAEMAVMPAAGINRLPSPLATVIFHYHKSDAYAPEYAAAVAPNQKVGEVERLMQEYAARPQGLADLVLLTPEPKVAQRRQEHPGVTVEPIKFSSAELGADSWKFLLGAYGNDSLYVRQLVAIMRRHRTGLTLDVLRQEVEHAELSKTTRQLAEDRLKLAEPYIDDSCSLGTLLRPGRTVIVDLRDEWIEREEALGLFVVMLRIFASSRHAGRDFNKLVVFDEAHKYITESDLIGQVVETIREMRHQATSVLIASQDPLSVPRAVIELTSVLVLHRMTSPQWLKHLKGAIVALNDVAEAQVAALRPGEALLWAQRSSDKRFTERPQKVTVRPRLTQHGGGTKTAVSGATQR